ncbi:hypothetical protein L226DRAFT_139593 [Lentinus tigrinus ALCF2SS1-7]|uniref:uncharacterized protein n=1 Tax=Lentinus tigrinus ALCF2SS1-7 TaxID=1328758 RepID=UPI001165E1D3|nr:hypothetical protein L226DRAFT_139593 [Lentinus tigrinus ALCF2SS1-7]
MPSASTKTRRTKNEAQRPKGQKSRSKLSRSRRRAWASSTSTHQKHGAHVVRGMRDVALGGRRRRRRRRASRASEGGCCLETSFWLWPALDGVSRQYGRSRLSSDRKRPCGLHDLRGSRRSVDPSPAYRCSLQAPTRFERVETRQYAGFNTERFELQVGFTQTASPHMSPSIPGPRRQVASLHESPLANVIEPRSSESRDLPVVRQVL